MYRYEELCDQVKHSLCPLDGIFAYAARHPGQAKGDDSWISIVLKINQNKDNGRGIG